MRYRLHIISTFLIILAIAGCGKQEKSNVVISIDKVRITAGEFDETFKNSAFAQDKSPGSKKIFLDNLIARKLILRYAEEKGLDRDNKFLKDVESFWQQSLLKLALDEKMRELSLSIKADDAEIKEYYNAHKETDFKDKEPEAVYNQVKWLIIQEKQGRAIESWINSLKKGSHIEIDYAALGINE